MIEYTDELPELVFTLPWVFDTVTRRVMEWKDKDLYDQIFDSKSGDSRVITNTRNNPELYALEVNACRKIYKTDFLKKQDFQFPLKLKWEDVPGHFQLLHEANTCMALPEIGFFYRINQGGQITSGGGASRLDMIPIFKQLLDVQKKFDFNLIERAYVLRVIIDFSMWSVDVTNQQYIGKLLEELHELYQTFPQKDISYYLINISKNKKKEKRFIDALCGKEYGNLADYRVRKKAIEKHANGKKNIIKGGIQCICDHGLSYTLVLMCRKFFSVINKNRMEMNK